MTSEYLIDVSRLVGRRLKRRLPTGIDRVALAYLRHYQARARAVLTVGNRAVVLPARHSRQLFDDLLAPGGERPVHRTLLRSILNAQVIPEGGDGWFLNTGHTGLHRPGYGTMLASLRARPLFLIHDLIPITHPQYCRAPEAQRHAERIRRAIGIGQAIVCNSEATFDSLTEFARANGLPLPPATVAPLATDRPTPALLDAARARSPLPTPYFVVIGTIEPRKNHLMLLQVWQRLIATLGRRAPTLVLIGQSGWECEHIERMLSRAPDLRERVLRPVRCDDTQVLAWLAHARALLFPSFAEGFGLPVLEAMQAGVPVIASDLPVLREFAGDRPEYLDPLDATGWMAAIADYQTPDSRRRERRVEALGSWTGPHWDDHFARVDDLMARVDRHLARTPSPQLGSRDGALESGHA